MKHFIFIYLLFQLSAFAQSDGNLSVVSLEKVNVVYRGIMNSIKIAVPGAKSYKVDAPGELIKIDSLGNYNWNVTSVFGLKAVFKIDITMADDSKIHETREFDIRNINPVKTIINGNKFNRNYLELTREEICDAVINLKIDDFLINAISPNLKAFEIIFSNEQLLVIYGNKLDTIACNKLKDLNVGEHIFIKGFTEYNHRIKHLEIKIIDNFIPPPVIALKNLNILYRGIENNIDIAVPGAKSFTVSAPGLRKLHNNTYSWKVTQLNSKTAELNFEIVTQNDSIFNLKERFQIKDIGKLIATINDNGCSNCIIQITKEEIKTAKIGLAFENTIPPNYMNFIIKEYNLELPDGNIYRVGENDFSYSAQKMITQFPIGSIFKIKNIKYVTHSYLSANPELKFMLVDKYD